MSSRHTPGPWHLGPVLPIVWDTNGHAICNPVTYHDKDNPGQSRANACLIASAPDMEGALTSMTVAFAPETDAQWKAMREALEALAKARGEG